MAGYGDDAGFAAWLAGEGYTLPPGSPTAAVLRQRGSRYIDATYGARFVGRPTGGIAQELAWPRIGAVAGPAVSYGGQGTPIPEDVVPIAVIEASYHAAWQEANTPDSLLGAVVSGAGLVKREKVDGAVEVEYAVSEATDLAVASRVVIPTVEGLLAPFLIPDVPVIGILAI